MYYTLTPIYFNDELEIERRELNAADEALSETLNEIRRSFVRSGEADFYNVDKLPQVVRARFWFRIGLHTLKQKEEDFKAKVRRYLDTLPDEGDDEEGADSEEIFWQTYNRYHDR